MSLFLLIPIIAAITNRPTLTFSQPERQALLGKAYDAALTNLLDINTLPYKAPRFERSGLLKERSGHFIRAGGDYQEPWTRDAAINSWNAASLLEPEVAKSTLFAVLDKDTEGRPIVQPDNQWWDKVIWIIGAWNHYVTTGDREFLETSYGVGSRLLAAMRIEHYDTEFGLFRGPSFFNDGIAGYPAPPAPVDDTGSTFVLDHPGTDKLMALSTNCLYVGAYQTMARMAAELRHPATESSEWLQQGEALKKTINQRFWDKKRGLYSYLLHGDGTLRGQRDDSEEGSGLSYAILFGIASDAQARSVLQHAHRQPFGITDVYPHFTRYSDAHPGRHNVVVWPVVQGLWARAATKIRDTGAFGQETMTLARLSQASDGTFYEIYDAQNGKVEGGWQSQIHFSSVPNQTWSATAYLSMITNGLFGMRFEPKGLRFEPMVPKGWGEVTLSRIAYRNALLNIHLHGEGTRIDIIRMDDKPLKDGLVPAGLSGNHRLDIVLQGTRGR